MHFFILSELVRLAIHILFLILLSEVNLGQNLNGTWKGNWPGLPLIYVRPKETIVEISVYKDSLISGVIHIYYKNDSYDHQKISGRFNRTDSTVHLTEDSTISYKKKWFEQTSHGKYELKLSAVENKFLLIGKWYDKKRGLFSLPDCKVWFEKQDLAFKEPAYANKDPFHESGADSASTPGKRMIDIQKVIEIVEAERDSIKIELYDNGEIDDDSVTVLFNDEILILKKRVSDKPLVFYVSLDTTQKMHKLKLIAENLGRIPPNTTLMIIKTKKERYEIYLTSSTEKNAVIEFFLIE